MRRLSFALALPALLALTLATPARADRHHESFGLSCDPPIRWSSRYAPDQARFAMDSEDGDITIVLTSNVVAMQLSDRKLRRVTRELRREEREDEDCPLGSIIKTAVLSGVRSLLDHSAECPIRAIRDVFYRDGRLVVIDEDGDRLFEDVDVHDEDVLEAFSDRDAQAFVREFHRIKSRTR